MALLHLAMEAAAAAAGWLYVKKTIVEGGTLKVSIVFLHSNSFRISSRGHLITTAKEGRADRLQTKTVNPGFSYIDTSTHPSFSVIFLGFVEERMARCN